MMTGVAFFIFIVACAAWFAARAAQERRRQRDCLMHYPLKQRLLGVHMHAAQHKARGALR